MDKILNETQMKVLNMMLAELAIDLNHRIDNICIERTTEVTDSYIEYLSIVGKKRGRKHIITFQIKHMKSKDVFSAGLT